MATTDSTSGTKTYEQVLAEVSAADGQSFFQAARLFEQAARKLGDTDDLLTKYRRDLDQAWQSQAGKTYNRIDKLIKDIEGIAAAVNNGYPASLRQIGDAITNSQQRLRALKAEADAKAKDAKDAKEAAAARSDLDKQATKIQEELSDSYRQLGGQLTALPERTATGGSLNLSSGGGGASGGGAGAQGTAPSGGRQGGNTGMGGSGGNTGTGGSGGNTGTGGMAAFAMTRPGGTATGFSQQGPGSTQAMGSGLAGSPQQLTMTGSAGSSGTAAQFARFSQFASGPGAVGGMTTGRAGQPAPTVRLANAFDSQSTKDVAKNSVLGKSAAPVPNSVTKDAKKDGKQNSSMSAFSMPSMMESGPVSSSSTDLTTLLSTAAGLAGPAMGSVQLPAQATAAAGGPPNGGTNPGGTPAPQPAQANSAPGQVLGQGPGQGPGPGPNPGPGLNLSQAGPAPADAAGATSGLANGGRSATTVHLPGAQPMVSPSAATTTSALSQLRPGMTELNHLQLPGMSPNGAPVVPGMTSGNSASAPFSPSSMMHAGGSALPAGPNGVLGGRSRKDNVWLRADPGCWTLTPLETGRLGRNQSTIDMERGAEPRVTTNPERKADERLDSPVQVLGRGQRGRARLARSRAAEAGRHHQDHVGSRHDGEGEGSVAYGGLRRAG